MKELEHETTYRMNRISEAFDKIRSEFNELKLSADVWIERLNDHKGCLQVYWFVKPTKYMVVTVNRIWELDFNEIETEHIFNDKKVVL
jgi:sugar-specific transcriptional regulator TrmB